MFERVTAFDFPFYAVERINEYEKANKYLLEILRQEKKADPTGRNVSNRGGYQTDHIWGHDYFHKFGEIIKPYMDELKNQIKIKDGFELAVDGAWINENKGFNFNVPHLHPRSHFACVYYVEFPKDSGSILFLNPNNSASMTGLMDSTDCTHFRHDLSLVPKTGSLIIFPSYFEHCVLQGDNISERVTCAFNLNVRDIREENESN